MRWLRWNCHDLKKKKKSSATLKRKNDGLSDSLTDMLGITFLGGEQNKKKN